ncbi:MAG: hypothetical protein AB1492_00835 [Bacillota bacterium]
MRALWAAVKLTLNTTYGFSAAKYRYLVKRQHLWELPLICLGIGSVAALFGAGAFFVAQGFVLAGLQFGQPELALTAALMATSLLVFFTGIMAISSVFFFADDLETLVALPLRPGAIATAKFGAVLAGEYIPMLLLFLPAAVAYSWHVGGGASFWVAAVLVGLLAPVLPLALATALAVLLMRAINRRHRDLYFILGTLPLVGVMLYVQMSITTIPPHQLEGFLLQLAAGRLDLVATLGRAYPPAVWATRAMAGGAPLAGWAGLAGVILSALGAAALAAVTSDRLLLGGLIGSREVMRRRGPSLGNVLSAGLGKGSQIGALFWREWRTFIRTPVWALNGLIGAVLLPLMMVFPAFQRGSGLGAILAQVRTGGPATFIATGVAAAMGAFVGSLNTTAGSALSREGRQLWISQMLPVAPVVQVQAKLLHALVTSGLCTLPALIMFAVLVNPPWLNIVAAGLVALAVAMAANVAGLLLDLWRPYLGWNNPEQATKQNLNVIVPMPVVGLLGFGLVSLTMALLRRGWGFDAVLAMVCGASAVPVVVLYGVALRLAPALYDRLTARGR